MLRICKTQTKGQKGLIDNMIKIKATEANS
ncbi:hypothetical protein Pgin01_01224 [Porphyromonas gingivalis]